MDAEAVVGLIGVVVGAVLATAGGVATELWRQRRDRVAAARLIWFELLRNWAVLFGAVAQQRWPQPYPFFEETWRAHGERLALAGKPEEFRSSASCRPCTERSKRSASSRKSGWDPQGFAPLVELAENTLRGVARTARISDDEMPFLRLTLEQRLAATQDLQQRIAALPDQVRNYLTTPRDVAQAMKSLPPELLAALRTLEGKERPSSD